VPAHGWDGSIGGVPALRIPRRWEEEAGMECCLMPAFLLFFGWG
jgi:hypothetical protein